MKIEYGEKLLILNLFQIKGLLENKAYTFWPGTRCILFLSYKSSQVKF